MVSYSRYARIEVLWSKQLEFFVPQLAFNVRNSLAYTERGFVNYNLGQVLSRMNFMNILIDGPNYGDENRGLRAGLQVSPATFDLMVSWSGMFDLIHGNCAKRTRILQFL